MKSVYEERDACEKYEDKKEDEKEKDVIKDEVNDNFKKIESNRKKQWIVMVIWGRGWKNGWKKEKKTIWRMKRMKNHEKKEVEPNIKKDNLRC